MSGADSGPKSDTGHGYDRSADANPSRSKNACPDNSADTHGCHRRGHPRNNRNRDAATAPQDSDPQLLDWLAQKKCFGCARGTHTHLSMETEEHSTRTFRVPPQLRAEFLERYVAEPGPLYLCEVTTGEGPFAMYLDLDYVDHTALAPERLLAIVHELQALVRGGLPERAASGADADPEADRCLVLVTGSDPTPTSEGLVKSGTHLRLPNLHVPLLRAKALRGELVNRLMRVMGDRGPHSWAKMVDDNVYSPYGAGLRMFGSRKSVKRVAGGPETVHKLQLVVPGSGVPDPAARERYAADPVALQRAVSAHCDSRSPTPGFGVVQPAPHPKSRARTKRR